MACNLFEFPTNTQKVKSESDLEWGINQTSIDC